MIPLYKQLKTKTLNTDDLLCLSEHLQEGICPIASMVFENKTFCMAINRFCWNHDEAIGDKNLYFRSNSGLLVRHVKNVKYKGFTLKKYDKNHKSSNFLNLLKISLLKNGQELILEFIFSHLQEIKVYIDKLEIYTTDLDDAWPTHIKPMHVYEHLAS